MEVVKFKNGRFGVRRKSSLSLFWKKEYEFLDMNKGDHWWSTPYINQFGQTDSELVARGWMKAIQDEEERLRKGPDTGTPV